jgi:TPR repeat protein
LIIFSFWFLKCIALGYFHENALGTTKNMDTAMEWYKKAAMHKNQLAMDRLKQANVRGPWDDPSFMPSGGDKPKKEDGKCVIQ